MAAFNFPNSPSLNQTHTDNGIVWKWNGSVWKRVEGVGAQGAQGYQGYQGVVGAQGVQGAQGHQGVQGAQGAQGVTGAQGHQGQVGAQGAQGAQGTPGSGGSAGAQGHQGHQGHQGNDGDDGSDGGAGAQGHQGHQGVPGSDGSDGSATISNNANDRIITGGSGTNLNGEANLQFNGTDLFVANDIKHLGDTDTYIEFTSDRIRLIAGGKALIDAIEAGTDSVTINEGGNDLDFRVEGQNDNHLISTDGANDRVGFSVGAPTEKVHIDGNVRITGAIKDKNNHAGSAGQVLSSTGTQLDWVEPSTLTYAVPAGGIIIWSGAANAIPSGWVLCNGSNSTPDLRGRFVVGYHNSDGDYDVNDYGGTASVTLSTSQIPAHSHDAGTLDADDDTHTHKGKNQSANASNANGHSVWVNDTHNGNYGSGSGWGGGPLGNRNFLEDNTHGHNISGSTGNRGGGGSHENRPPYYALCYIMKT